MTTQIPLFTPPPPVQDPQPPSGWDRSLTDRHRVLLHAQPLLDLRQRDGKRDPETRHYDTLALALRVMDLVVERMGMDREVDRELVGEVLGPLLRAMDVREGVEPDRARHVHIVDLVLGALRNDGDSRRRFSLEYTDFGEDGAARTAQLEFWLARDHYHPGGGTVLRLSPEAINLFLRAMDLDIEDGQAAAEAVVESQIRRGRFEEAVQSARLAQVQSIRFRSKVETLLLETQRDISRVDWVEAAPRLLEEALTHLEARLASERAILATADERLDTLEPESAAARAVAEVRGLVESCRARHLGLQPSLMRARNVFLDAQLQQAFRPAASRMVLELHAEVLTGVVGLPRRDAIGLLADFLPAWFGARPTATLSLADLIAWQLRPKRERSLKDIRIEEEVLIDREAEERGYDEEIRARAEARVESLTGRSRLGDILVQARTEGASDRELELLASFAFEVFAPEDINAAFFSAEALPGELFDLGAVLGDDLELVTKEGRDGDR